ncbi:MAG: lipid A deacylase LpxR family protein [Sedimentisphaerales bacterium]|nr:lipid A deacylase LpxR family protein [Sedimentisphaerales bacterium]MBN2842057.1 lipid A deacylase LpxR family protein [Sedimentisphaerales bacterium]
MDIKSALTSFLLIMPAISTGVTTGIYWENDGTFAKPNHDTDRHYTNGARIDIAWTDTNNCLTEPMNSLPWYSDNETKSNFGIFIGQHMQTPDFIASPDLRPDPEMRYAGWLYGGPFVQTGDNMNMDHLELSLGVIGPSALGKETQDFIHGLRELEKAVDWDSQMSDRFAGNINWLHKFRIGTNKYYSQGPIHLELLGETAVALGSVHRNAGTGLTLRVGSDLSNDFGPGSMSRPRYYIKNTSQSSISAFARIAGSVVEHNELLDGLSEETLLGELQVGFAFSYKKLTLSYSQVFMTRQYEKQPEPDSYGAFTVHCSF